MVLPEVLQKRLPPSARKFLRCLVLALNVVFIIWVVADAEVKGVGLEVVQLWVVLTMLMSQVSLLWKLVSVPRALCRYLALPSVGLLAGCHGLKLLEAPLPIRDSGQMATLDWMLATASLMAFALATWQRRRLAGELEATAAAYFALSGTAFGGDLLWRHLEGPSLAAMRRTSKGALPLALLEHLMLPVVTLLVAVLLLGAEELAGFRDLSRVQPVARAIVAPWCRLLEAVALLPQLRVLLALRRESGDVVVPEELKYWLVSAAVGHFLAFATALVDSLVPQGGGARALAVASSEGLNAAVLGELLVAHAYAKCRGDKQLVLPT